MNQNSESRYPHRGVADAVMNALIGLTTALVLATTDPTDIHSDKDFPAFKAFIDKYRAGLPYASELETIGRFTAFKANLQRITERNAKGAEKHGVTQFADLTPAEFRAKFTGFRPTSAELKKKMVPLDHGMVANYSTPVSIDWNAKGALTPVKNQGQCGSCWAFSATEQLESDYYLKYKQLKTLSPQQITSCTASCLGCGGGNPIDAWQYVHAYGGQDPSSDYPYLSGLTGQTGSCDASSSEVSEDVSSKIGYLISSAPSDEANMLKQMEASPMSIIVDATLWQTYQSGVITTASGCGSSLDHAVQATGYNKQGDYWIIRNCVRLDMP